MNISESSRSYIKKPEKYSNQGLPRVVEKYIICPLAEELCRKIPAIKPFNSSCLRRLTIAIFWSHVWLRKALELIGRIIALLLGALQLLFALRKKYYMGHISDKSMLCLASFCKPYFGFAQNWLVEWGRITESKHRWKILLMFQLSLAWVFAQKFLGIFAKNPTLFSD